MRRRSRADTPRASNFGFRNFGLLNHCQNDRPDREILRGGIPLSESVVIVDLRDGHEGGADRDEAVGGGRPVLGAAEPVLTGLRVLVVDDEADARDVIAELLGDAGARVQTASSVDEALRSVDASRPDAIVSDIGMPKRDGYSFIHELRTSALHRAQAVPVIAFTAFDGAIDRTLALRSGFTSHVSKTDSTDLATAVASAIGRNVAAS